MFQANSMSVRWSPAQTRVSVLAIALGTLLLTVAAVYNGYPLIYGDSTSYIGSHDPRHAHWARPVFYSLFLLPLHAEVSLWPALVAQCAMLAHLVWLMVRTLVGTVSTVAYLLLMIALTATSSLPWLTAWIMPDVMTSVGVLGMFLLGFCWDRLGRVERIYLVALTAVAIAAHLSHLPLAVAVAGCVLGTRAVWLGREAELGRSAARVLVPLGLAIGAHLAANEFARHELSVSPASSLFLLARLIADGPAKQYLDDHCATQAFRLCQYRDELPADADAFLWNHDGPFYKAGEEELIPEARQIVRGTLAEHPIAVLKGALWRSALQFVHADTATELNRYDEAAPVSQTIHRFFEPEYDMYLRSRQETGLLDLGWVQSLDRWMLVLAGALDAGLLVVFVRRRDRLFVALAAVIVGALVANALVTGGVSGVHDRYQARLVWLSILYAGLGLIRLARLREPENGELMQW